MINMEITYSERVEKLFHPKAVEEMVVEAIANRELMQSEEGELPIMVYLAITPSCKVRAEYFYPNKGYSQELILGTIFDFEDYLD